MDQADREAMFLGASWRNRNARDTEPVSSTLLALSLTAGFRRWVGHLCACVTLPFCAMKDLIGVSLVHFSHHKRIGACSGMRTARTRPCDVSFAHGPRHAPYKENRKKRLVSFPTTFALQFSSISATAA